MRLHRRRDDRAPNSTGARRRLPRQPADPVRGRAGRDPPGRLGRYRTRRRPNRSTNGTPNSTRWVTPRPHSSGRSAGSAANRPPPSPNVLVHGDFRMGNLIIDTEAAPGPARRGARLGAHPQPARSYEDLALVLHQGVALRGATTLGAGGLGSVEDFLRAYEARLRRGARPGRDALVAGPVHAALGRHLPLPGRATPVRPDALRRTGRDRPPRLRDRVRPARPCWRRRHDRPARPTDGGRTGRRRRGVPRDRRPRRHDRCGQLPRPRRRQRAAHRRARTARRHRGRTRRRTARPGLLRRARALGGDQHAASSTTAAPNCLPLLRTLVRHRLAVAHPGYEQRIPVLSRAGPAPTRRARRAWFPRARRGPRSAAPPPRRGRS